MLKVKNLTKRYGEKVALDSVSFEVQSGDITAFIGHNGAGKTTALKSIAGILNFDDGEIIIDGISVNGNSLKTKSMIGYLPDNPELYDSLTGIGYLNFIADVFGVDENLRKERIENYAKRLGIFDDLQNQISTYSHGMKQKIAIISVLVHKPKLYLFDEPFVGLDPVVSHEFKQIMKEETQSGSAILFSTHILEVAEKLCSKIVVIKNGRIVGSGSMAEIKGDESLEKFFLELEDEKHN
ncbi:MAG: ABC transporter ATP-binding protein [Christensenellales bacterium]